MMKKVAVVLALIGACSLGLTAAFAGGPACSGAKTAAAKSGCTKTCGEGAGAFPAVALMVGDKKFDCCMSAAAAAKEAKTSVTYVVDGEKYDSKDKADAALADVAEKYTERFLTIACVADGKVMYCGADKCCADKSKTVSAKSETCPHAKTAAMAKTDDAKSGTCTHAKTAAVAKTTDAKSETCTHARAGAMAKAEGSGCCKSKAGVKMTKEEIEACCKTAKVVKYMVGGRTFDKREDAVAAHTKLMETVKPIKLTYLVNGKEVDCSSKICPQDKKAGNVKYVVNKDKMDCEVSARIAVAKAKWEAARNAAEKLAKI